MGTGVEGQATTWHSQHRWHGGRHSGWAVALGLAAAATSGLVVVAAGLMASHRAVAEPAAIESVVQVRPEQELGPINPLLFGINTARWDQTIFPGPASDMLLSSNRDIIQKVKDSGVTILKYPGGLEADGYIWNNPSNPAADMDTDELVAFARAVGAEPWIQVNVPAGPELAAAWVDYTNNLHHYNVKYWEIGDEEYGYWALGHSSPEVYAQRFRAFVTAMKAKDPSIQIAASVVGVPGYDDWTRQVIRLAGDVMDMVTFSFYPLEPGQESPAAFIRAADRLQDQLDYIHQILREEQPARADQIKVMIGGWNTVTSNPSPLIESIPNALFVAQVLGNMLTLDVDGANYWAIYNPPGKRGGEYGYLKSISHEPTYPYYVFQMFRKHFGDVVVQSKSPRTDLKVYASISNTGYLPRLSVILLNLNAGFSQKVKLDLGSFATGQFTALLLDKDHRLDSWPVSEDGTVTLPPYSAVVVNATRRPVAGDYDQVFPIGQEASSELAGYEASRTVDNNPNTRWSSRMGADIDPQWLQFDFGFPTHLGKVTLRWEAAYATQYEVQLSSDGQNWQTVATVTDGHGGLETVTFPAQDARYLRLLFQRRADPRWGYSIWEVELYRQLE
ncbi:MAG: discoidin domain-containing protein [Limnochordaceae bacterium]|nr:discoidin domain-containing protein [Limnochordaceae bacterium]